MAIPVLAYLNVNWDDLDTWGSVLDVIVGFISNPFLIGLTIINGINLLPDPTTDGLKDSKLAMSYLKAKKDK